MRSGKWKWTALLVALAVTRASAGYGAEAYPFALAYISGIGVGATAIAVTLTGGGAFLANNDQGAFVIAVWALLGVSVTGLFAAGSNHKELAHQLKVDHDIYTAGGEMTPFLQGVYQEVRTRSQELQLKDGPCVGGEIDELKMTEAIDKLVALAGNP